MRDAVAVRLLEVLENARGSLTNSALPRKGIQFMAVGTTYSPGPTFATVFMASEK
jgi:hypothetical protein